MSLLRRVVRGEGTVPALRRFPRDLPHSTSAPAEALRMVHDELVRYLDQAMEAAAKGSASKVANRFSGVSFSSPMINSRAFS